MRKISREESTFVSLILEINGFSHLSKRISGDTLVTPMNDGGMGSLYFPESDTDVRQGRRMGKEILRGLFVDDDGTPVSFTINLDEDGRLFELDVWKVDGTPLVRLPAKSSELADDASGQSLY